MLVGPRPGKGPAEEAADRQGEINLIFHQVSFHVGQRVTLLHNLTGTLHGGRLTAILGSSGAGKTTLLKLLACHVSGGEQQGVVLVNGVPLNPAEFRRQLAVVWQTDVLLPTATVREAILTSALLKLPQRMPLSEKNKRVDDIIEELDLGHCADTLIGLEIDGAVCGISGGERRRVSVGIGLVADARVLFLDEPTTGLDSESAEALINLLSRLAARKHRTVVCTIHQPSSDICNMFDDLLLMSSGRLLYCGAWSCADAYFNDAGFRRPEYRSAAEHMLHICKDKAHAVPTLAAAYEATAALAAKQGILGDVSHQLTGSPVQRSGSIHSSKDSAFEPESHGERALHASPRQLCYKMSPLGTPRAAAARQGTPFPTPRGLASHPCPVDIEAGIASADTEPPPPAKTQRFRGVVPPINLTATCHMPFTLAQLSERAKKLRCSPLKVDKPGDGSSREAGGAAKGGVAEFGASARQSLVAAPVTVATTITYQVWVLARRFWLSWVRSPAHVAFQGFQFMFAALILGAMYYHLEDTATAGSYDRAASLWFAALVVVFQTGNNACTIFYSQKPLLRRELSGGLYHYSAFFIAKSLTSLPFLACYATLYTLTVYFMVGYQAVAAKFWTFYLLMGLMMLISETLGILCAGFCRSELVGIIVLQAFYVPLLMFTGFFQTHTPAYFVWIKKLSYVTYGYTGLVENEFEGLKLYTDLSGLALPDARDVIPGNIRTDLSMGANLAVLLCILIGLRCVQYAQMQVWIYLHRM